MKKILSWFLYITCILTLVACGKRAAPITLPRADEITSIDITFEENTVSHSDKTWISEVIADISSSEPTKKESVQDFPLVESYIKAAVEGKDKKMQECYGADKISDEAKTEISSTVKYFQAHGAKDVNIDSCEAISESKNYTYVYIRYNLVLQNDQEYPCISTYLVKVQDKKYYLYSPAEISDEISQQAAADYQKFMTTKTYTDYTKAYEVFLKKNPGYEDKIAGKLNG